MTSQERKSMGKDLTIYETMYTLAGKYTMKERKLQAIIRLNVYSFCYEDEPA